MRINRRPGFTAVATAIVLATFIAGCRSSSSTMFSRNETNSGWMQFRRVHGFPITIKVPTHLKLHVYEKHFLEEGDGSYVDLPVTIRDFAHEMVYSEKIVMVDFKRPAAGTFNLDVDLTEDQYIKKIQHDVTDETLEQVNAILGTLSSPGGLFNPASTDADPPQTDGDKSLREVRSVVAVGVFEIDAPDFELQINEFLNCHINKAHDAWSAAPGPKDVKRVFPADHTDLQLCPQGACAHGGVVSPFWSAGAVPAMPPSDPDNDSSAADDSESGNSP